MPNRPSDINKNNRPVKGSEYTYKTAQGQSAQTSTGTMTQTKKRGRYTKAQVIRNRIILVMSCIAIFGFSYWGISVLSQSVLSDNSDSQPESSMPVSSEPTESPDNNSDSGPRVIGTVSEDTAAEDSEESSEENDSSDDTSDESAEETVYPNPYPYDETPVLVNKEYPIEEGYVPELTELSSGYYIATDVADALNDMISAANADGINIYVVSAYRSVEHQTNNYNNRVNQYMNEGHSEEEAKKLTEQFIAPPNNSEHSLGLAVDFNSLYQSFEDTAEFAWLYEHCAEFGFILRYAKDKTNITGYSYEPWHYRYVGTNHSYKIMEQGVSLEEYLSSQGN